LHAAVTAIIAKPSDLCTAAHAAEIKVRKTSSAGADIGRQSEVAAHRLTAGGISGRETSLPSGVEPTRGNKARGLGRRCRDRYIGRRKVRERGRCL